MFYQLFTGASLLLLTTMAVVPENYQSLSAADKQGILYDQCVAGEGTQGALPGALDLAKFLWRDINPSFDHPMDENLYNSRPIHPRGVVFNMRFNAVPNNPFSGVFQGSEHNMIRLSLASEPTDDGNTKPGVGVKFLRDNMRSANFVAMFSLDGQDSDDFFLHTFRNHLDTPKPSGLRGKIFDKKFRTASEQPFMVGLSDLAEYDIHGNKIAKEDVKFPFQLILRPNPELSMTIEETVMNIAIGTTLYNVWAQEEPESELIEIGDFITTSEGVTSAYGDNVLFFQHQRMTDDLCYKPTWTEIVTGKKEKLHESRCPFGF